MIPLDQSAFKIPRRVSLTGSMILAFETASFRVTPSLLHLIYPVPYGVLPFGVSRSRAGILIQQTYVALSLTRKFYQFPNFHIRGEYAEGLG